MTKCVEYRCNFCGSSLLKVDKVFGIYWTGKGGGDTINVVPAIQSENHLCHTCYNAFGRHFVDLHEHEKARAESFKEEAR